MHRVLVAIVLSLVLVVVLLGTLLASCAPDAPIDVKELARVDEPLPDIEAPSLDGDPIQVEDYVGQPMVLNAWASWCFPCREEQPMLNDLYETYGDRVTFLGVNSKDTEAPAAEHAREFAIPYPSVVDPDGSIAIKDLGIDTGLPGTIVVDADGRIRYRVKGKITREELEPMLTELLGEPSGSSLPATPTPAG